MTIAAAKKLGYELVGGNYCGGSDDIAGRWYWIRESDSIIDKCGRGFSTKKSALESLENNLLSV